MIFIDQLMLSEQFSDMMACSCLSLQVIYVSPILYMEKL